MLYNHPYAELNETTSDGPNGLSTQNTVIIIAVVVVIFALVVAGHILGITLRYCTLRMKRKKMRMEAAEGVELECDKKELEDVTNNQETAMELRVLDNDADAKVEVHKEEQRDETPPRDESQEVTQKDNRTDQFTHTPKTEHREDDIIATKDEETTTATIDGGDTGNMVSSAALSLSKQSKENSTSSRKVRLATRREKLNYVEVDFGGKQQRKAAPGTGSEVKGDSIIGDSDLDVAYATVMNRDVIVPSPAGDTSDTDDADTAETGDGRRRDFYDL